MPFTSVTELPADPDVRIFFTGLLILDPNPGNGSNACEVFVHRSAPDHRLTIEVRRKRRGRPDIIMMRHIGQLHYMATPGATPRFGMFIEVDTDPQGVRRYDPVDPQNTSPEGEGLGLAIDLERLPSLSAPVGGVSEQGGRPSILINDGVFYTAARSDSNVVVRLKKEGTVIVPNLPPFASVIGANVYLRDGASVILSWVQRGLPQVLNLPKPTEDHLSYEIYIVNEPLYEFQGTLLPAHDELREYFKILPDAKDRYELEVPPPQPGTPPVERGSTTTPCMPVVKGG